MAKKRHSVSRLSMKIFREAARVFGRRGGKARLKRMTAEDRQRVARTAAQARWAKGKSSDPSSRRSRNR